MSCVDVVRLAESFLSDLPVGTDDIGDVGFNTSVFKIPDLELLFDSAEEVAQGFAILVGIDENESGPGIDCTFGQTEILFLSLFNMGEIPLCWNVSKFTLKGPRESMKWATNLFAVTVVVLKLATTM